MSDPLFILAPPRSYTSVVCGMIGQHPEMLGLPEINLFAGDDYQHLSRWYRIRPRFQHGLLRAIAELGLGEQNEANIEAARHWLEENPKLETKAIYQDLANWAAPRSLVDKSPIYVYDAFALDRIDRACPRARYLHLLRHPRGTCESIQALRREHSNNTNFPPLDPETSWLKPHLRILEFLETIPTYRKIRIRGEDLLEKPACYLPQIVDWLGLDSSPASIEPMFHPERSPFACNGPPNARFGNDPGFLNEPRLRPYRAPALSLEGPMSWDSRISFSNTLKHYALFFGYD